MLITQDTSSNSANTLSTSLIFHFYKASMNEPSKYAQSIKFLDTRFHTAPGENQKFILVLTYPTYVYNKYRKLYIQRSFFNNHLAKGTVQDKCSYNTRK